MEDAGASGGTASTHARSGAWRANAVEHVLAVVCTCLRETFPDDFYRRCAYSAFAISNLLRDEGMDAAIVGGQFAALVVAADGSRMAIQGFLDGPEPFPHLWVEAENRLIDPGPYLLAFGSEYPVLPMPMLVWDMRAPLPSAFQYKIRESLAGTSPMSPDPAVRAQSNDFVGKCRARAADPALAPALDTWIVVDDASLHGALERGDLWASAARSFEQASPICRI